MLVSLFVACGPINVSDDAGGVDSAVGDSGQPADTAANTDSGGGDTSDTDVGNLHGATPKEALPAPVFSALNRDGSSRSKPDLVGHPTVVWFYPLANSAG